MTPKEKAKELYDRFLQFTPVEFEDEYTKECSKIAVDMIINEAIENDVEDFYDGQGYYIDNEIDYVYGYIEYWDKVKTEIEAL